MLDLQVVAIGNACALQSYMLVELVADKALRKKLLLASACMNQNIGQLQQYYELQVQSLHSTRVLVHWHITMMSNMSDHSSNRISRVCACAASGFLQRNLEDEPLPLSVSAPSKACPILTTQGANHRRGCAWTDILV